MLKQSEVDAAVSVDRGEFVGLGLFEPTDTGRALRRRKTRKHHARRRQSAEVLTFRALKVIRDTDGQTHKVHDFGTLADRTRNARRRANLPQNFWAKAE